MDSLLYIPTCHAEITFKMFGGFQVTEEYDRDHVTTAYQDFVNKAFLSDRFRCESAMLWLEVDGSYFVLGERFVALHNRGMQLNDDAVNYTIPMPWFELQVHSRFENKDLMESQTCYNLRYALECAVINGKIFSVDVSVRTFGSLIWNCDRGIFESEDSRDVVIYSVKTS